MVRPVDSRFDSYAKHRIRQRVFDLFPTYGNWEAMAASVSEAMMLEFPRTYFNRLRKNQLGDSTLETLVQWIERSDPGFRAALKPEGIFAEVGVSSRDYYFHLHRMPDLDAWDEALLQEYEGCYLCAPEYDRNAYLPMSRVRRVILDKEGLPQNWKDQRINDWRIHLAKRSILILKRTTNFHFWAAEIPLTGLYPQDANTNDITTYYEGVGIASSNTIHVFLRDCLSRAPRFHSLLIRPKSDYKVLKTRAGELYAPAQLRDLDSEIIMLTDDDIAHMQREFAEPLASDVFLTGNTQTSIPPLAWAKLNVDMIDGAPRVYHKKPASFLDDPATHLLHADLTITPQLEDILANPLLIGEMMMESKS
ncbi:MAG: hypothetical protein ACE360_11330 [Hyphomicrobiales bacterium]